MYIVQQQTSVNITQAPHMHKLWIHFDSLSSLNISLDAFFIESIASRRMEFDWKYISLSLWTGADGMDYDKG